MATDNKPKAGEFCWNELATANVPAAKKFYSSVFGWEFTDHDMGDMTYTMIKRDDKELGGMWQIPNGQEKDIPPHWMSYILVDNVETSLDNAVKQGASVVKAVTKAGDFGKLAIITDPVGAYIALWQQTGNK